MTFDEVGIDTKGRKGTFYDKCPKCSHDRKAGNKSKPCLTVHVEIENNWWKCHNCDWSGSLEAFGKYDKVRKKANVPEKVAYSKPFLKYWKDRGISESTLKKCFVYYRTESFPTGDDKKPYTNAVAACFPYFKSYSVVNVKFRSINDKLFKMLKTEDGAELTFWGWEAFDPEGKYAIITEGEPDRMTFIECGYKNVLSVPLGAPSPKSKKFDKEFQYINKYSTTQLEKIPIIYIAVDNDEAGLILQKELARRIGKERCRVIKYPDKIKDINEVYVTSKFDKASVKFCVESSDPVPIQGIVRVYDIPIQDYDAFYDIGFTKGLVTGEWNDFDALFSCKRKLLTAITGTSQTGKTEWLLSYLYHLAENNPNEHLKFAMFSPESRPIIRLISRIVQIRSRKPMYKNAYNRIGREEYHEALKWVNNHFVFIAPPDRVKDSKGDSLKTLDGILKYGRILVQQEGVYAMIIDPWNKVEHDRPPAMTEKEYISKSLDDIMYFSEINDTHFFIIAHPIKIHTDQRSGNKREVFLEDISGAAEWETKIDQGISMYRPFYAKNESSGGWYFDKTLPTSIKVLKMKFEEVGSLGKVKMWYDLYGGGRFVEDENKLTVKPDAQMKISDAREKEDDCDPNDLPF